MLYTQQYFADQKVQAAARALRRAQAKLYSAKLREEHRRVLDCHPPPTPTTPSPQPPQSPKSSPAPARVADDLPSQVPRLSYVVRLAAARCWWRRNHGPQPTEWIPMTPPGSPR